MINVGLWRILNLPLIVHDIPQYFDDNLGVNQRHWRRSGNFIVNFEHASHFFLVVLLLTLNK